MNVKVFIIKVKVSNLSNGISRNNESFGSENPGCEFQQPQVCVHNADHNTGPLPKSLRLSFLIYKGGK